MSFFDSFLDTASKGLDWLNNNQAVLDTVAGVAKGYGQYLTYKQNANQFNTQYDLMKRQFEDEQSRKSAPNDYNSGDFTTGLAEFKPGTFLAGSMSNAMGGK